MSTVQRMCEQCSRITPHTVQPFMPPTSGLPTADAKVDLTGRQQEHMVQHTSMPMVNRYRCMVCGHEVVEAGGFGQTSGGDALDKLLRGDDFKASDDV